jgi:hypothetical protein
MAVLLPVRPDFVAGRWFAPMIPLAIRSRGIREGTFARDQEDISRLVVADASLYQPTGIKQLG